MLRMLRGEDVVEGGQLVIIGKAGFRIPPVQFLCQFQHVIGVTGLRTVDVVDEVHAGILAGEMFTTAVTTEGQRALTRYDLPEINTGIVIGLIA